MAFYGCRWDSMALDVTLRMPMALDVTLRMPMALDVTRLHSTDLLTLNPNGTLWHSTDADGTLNP